MPARTEIIARPPCATELVATTGDVSRDVAREILRALIKAGFAVVPMEPTNSMFEAYMTALKQPPHSHKTVIENIGKARKRWKAMAIAGVAVTFSTENISIDV